MEDHFCAAKLGAGGLCPRRCHSLATGAFDCTTSAVSSAPQNPISKYRVLRRLSHTSDVSHCITLPVITPFALPHEYSNE